MSDLMFCLNATLPVFFMMALGYILHRIGWVSDAFASGMNSFVFKLALPVSLFTELCDVDVAAVWDGWYILFCLVVTALSIFIAFLLSFLLKDKSVRGEFVQGAYRSSASLLGMTYLENMYSSAESGSLMMLGSVPLYNVAAVIVLSLMPGYLSETADSRGGAGGSGDTENSTVTGNGMTAAGSGDRENGTVTGNGIAAAGSGDRENSTVSADGRTIETGGKSAGVAGGRAEGLDGARMKKTLYGILTNPIIWGIFLGFGWALLKLPMPQMLDTTLNYIGRCASPMGLLAMGASLDFSALTKKIKPVIGASFLKLIGFPLLFMPLAVLAGFRGQELAAALIMTGSASTVAGYVMAKNMGHEGTVSAGTVALTTLLASFTLTFWLFVLRIRGYL